MTEPRNRRSTDRPTDPVARTRWLVRMISGDATLKAWLGQRIARALEHTAVHLDLRDEKTAAADVRRIAGAYRRGEVDPL